MEKELIISKVKELLEQQKVRSAWDKGVKVYAEELIEEIENNLEYYEFPLTIKQVLNGADNWKEYSWGGSALIYDSDIAERLCTPSELKRNKQGERRPNNHEEWLDVQARALRQAGSRVFRLVNRVVKIEASKKD